MGCWISAMVKTHGNERWIWRSRVSERLPNVLMGDLLAACNEKQSCGYLRSAVEGGMRLSIDKKTKITVMICNIE